MEMKPARELEWLQRLVRSCSGSAVAYETAFMRATRPDLARHLLARCTERYALLERLLSHLVEGWGVAPQQTGELLAQADPDPARRPGTAAAMWEAEACDRVMLRLIEQLLRQAALPAAMRELLTLHCRKLQRQQAEDERFGPQLLPVARPTAVAA